MIIPFVFPQPVLENRDQEVDYDSAEDSDGDDDAFDEDDEDEDLDPFSNAPPPADNVQHSDPGTLVWL